MPLSPDELYLAENCYGYGRWDADYWFIGIEERLDSKNPRDTLPNRAKAFRDLNAEGLCDCHEFHERLEIDDWQTELQFTWGRLIWLLKNYLKESFDDKFLLEYQRNCWGRSNGSTCVTELSGLPRDSSEQAKKKERQWLEQNKNELATIRDKRITFLRDKIQKHEPKLAVFYGYGKTQGKYWKCVAETELAYDEVVKGGKTTFVWSPHPNRYGRRIEEWEELGRKLAESNRP